jgi:pyruvate ferredoxin oxidoreductase alpha subunit
MVTLESEHSMVTAAGAAAATGVRTFTATSSQGLLHATEMLYAVAGWRAPFVLVNVSRGIAAPLTLESDHNDVMAVRDSGFLQIHCATCQEVVDSVLLAYRMAEDQRVRLPVLVNLDGFYLSFTREPVELPEAEAMTRFLGPFDPGRQRFSASHPTSQAVAVLGGSPYSYFRYEMQLAAANALAVYDQLAGEFEHATGRHHPAVEAYRMEDAEFAFVMLGSFATKASAAVDVLRERGQRVGLVRPRLFRPFPELEMRRLLCGRRSVGVIDQNLATGHGGVLHGEIAAALYRAPGAPPLVSFIGGLGGRDIPLEEFAQMADVLLGAGESGQAPPPRLLFTQAELREMRRLQGIAAAEQSMAAEPRAGGAAEERP